MTVLTRDKLVNIVVFLERAAKVLNGTNEARAWAQTYEAVHNEIEMIDVPPQSSRPAVERDIQ